MVAAVVNVTFQTRAGNNQSWFLTEGEEPDRELVDGERRVSALD